MKYDSKIEYIYASTGSELQEILNKFFNGKFVIATQVFKDGENFEAFVYYKVAI